MRPTGRGKLLFFGEHAAVYGFPAVGVTLPMGIRIELKPSLDGEGGRLRGVRPEHRTKFEELLEATRTVPGLPEVFDGVDILVESDLPTGRGLGSSAALCVALVAAASRGASSGMAASSEALWAYAHQAERLFHGSPSGIDTGLASGTGLAALYPRPEGLPERRPISPAPFWLVAGTVPRTGCAFDLIRGVGEGYAGERRSVDAIRELGAVSERAIEVFSSSPTSAALIESLAPLADAAQERLAGLGLSSHGLEAVLAAGRRAGARVGKLSGAGGGGAFFFLAENGEAAAAIHAAVAEVFGRGLPGDLFKPFFWTGTELEADDQFGPLS
jgi:mevalonate kinase